MSLDIVSNLLQGSEITVSEQDLNDSYGNANDRSNVSGNFSMELDEVPGMLTDQNILSADTSNWDPFDDADKFERLAAA
jgi:hypothetical protein